MTGSVLKDFTFGTVFPLPITTSGLLFFLLTTDRTKQSLCFRSLRNLGLVSPEVHVRRVSSVTGTFQATGTLVRVKFNLSGTSCRRGRKRASTEGMYGKEDKQTIPGEKGHR